MSADRIEVRALTFKGNVYVRLEDVCRLILEAGATEETDVRKRLGAIVENLSREAMEI